MIFESCPPRHNKTSRYGMFCFKHDGHEVHKDGKGKSEK
jgi:hypothetical protein